VELRAHEIAIPEVISRAGIADLEAAIESAPPGRPWVLRAESELAFCNGMDLAEATAGDPRDALGRFARALIRLTRASAPTIALVDGEARGGGVGIAAACDFVIATDRASFALPEALFGLSPATIAPVLTMRLSAHALRLWTIRACMIDALHAERIGLVDRVIDRAEIASAATRAVRELSRAAVDAMPGVRELGAPPDEAILEGAERTLERLRDPVVRGRIRAFLEDGAPPWSC
jgi:polyketide biosynthesis enoyl-CoA hydratase PksH